MKSVSKQLALFLKERGVRRNLGAFSRFLFLMLGVICFHSFIFHLIMKYEGQEYSLFTGVYWTLTVMSTLGFGDITFHSDLGKLFSIVVLISGFLCLLIMLPFAFIQLIYTPWMEAQKKSRLPREIPETVSGHIIMAGLGPIALNVADDLQRYGFHCALLTQDPQTTLDLTDRGYHAVFAGHDQASVYANLGLERAAMLVVMENDIRNTNIVFSAREFSAGTPIIAMAEKSEALDVLMLAGATKVFQFHNLLGKALAKRVLNDQTRLSILTRFDSLVVAEAPATRTSLVGKTLLETDLRRQAGINIVGIREKGVFRLPRPDTRLTEKTVLILAGTQEQMDRFEQQFCTSLCLPAGPIMILGGGKVGEAAARELQSRQIEVAIVDKSKTGTSGDGIQWVYGDASDLAVLETAGIKTAPAAIITTHDDETNTYLTIYCRKLRPDMQIISRASLDRNFGLLHAAGADLVLSLSSLILISLINILSPGKVYLLNEGLSFFRTAAGRNLAGKTLRDSGIRSKTNCSVVAVYDTADTVRINPDPEYTFAQGDTLFLIGDSAAETAFYDLYGREAPQAAGALKQPIFPNSGAG